MLAVGPAPGALPAAASRPASERVAPSSLFAPAVAVTLLCLVTTGWLTPEGYRATVPWVRSAP